MANINGNTIPGGVDWSGISNALYNALQQPYNERTVGPLDTPQSSQVMGTMDAGGNYAPTNNYAGAFDSFASDNQAINGPGYYQGQPLPHAAGSINNGKDQSQLQPDGGQAFAYQSPPLSNPLGAIGNAVVGGLKALPPASMIRKLAPQAGAPAVAQPRPAVQAPQPRGLAAMPVPTPLTKIQQFQQANPGASPSQAYNAVGARAMQQAAQPNGQVYAAITGNSGGGNPGGSGLSSTSGGGSRPSAAPAGPPPMAGAQWDGYEWRTPNNQSVQAVQAAANPNTNAGYAAYLSKALGAH